MIKSEITNSESAYVLFNLFLFIAFMSMYLISRVNIGKVREGFMREKSLKEAMELLNRIIENNQDGILITVKENIIMYNRQISSIFEDDS